MVKAETKALKAVLAALGVRGVRVRTDTTLQWTTATALEPAAVAAIDAHAEELAASGYGVTVTRYADGEYSMALVTTDRRRAGTVSRTTASSLAG